ncbi:Hypothetical protein NTJ_09584 [Nesidiocoris tenuis]|uniref:Ionotropic glutamate receptor C-terminal domain-containing protein n=1 Tax=Nesidiocoris tenuis TaxID=355587 RepID=A0ABN7AX51_9HEMI|nr:Hypothetical protein NTJ_09584 [Nesidiocoris tenuis]
MKGHMPFHRSLCRGAEQKKRHHKNMPTNIVSSFMILNSIYIDFDPSWRNSEIALYQDDLYTMQPEDYVLLYQTSPALILLNQTNRDPRTANIFLTDNVSFLHSFLDVKSFFRAKLFYSCITNNVTDEIEDFLHTLWHDFRVAGGGIIPSTKEIFYYKPSKMKVIIEPWDEGYTARKMKQDSLAGIEGLSLSVVYFPREGSFEVENGTQYLRGQDGEIMKIIAEKLNMPLQLTRTTDGRKYGSVNANGSVEGAFNDLLIRKANITGNSHFVKDYGINGIVFTAPVSADQLSVLVPAPRKIPTSVALARMLGFEIIFTHLLLCLTGTQITQYLGRVLGVRNGQNKMSQREIFSLPYRMFLGVPTVFRSKLLSDRILLSACLLTTLVISNYFQGYMTTISSTTVREKLITTLEDLRKSRIEIVYSNKDVSGYMSDSEDRKGVNFKLVSVEESIAASNRCDVGRTQRIYSIFNRQNIMYRGKKSQNIMGVVNECLVTYPLAFVMTEGFPLIDKVNSIVVRVVQSGLYQKWTFDGTPFGTYIPAELKKTSSNEEPVRLAELYYALAILQIGIAISSVVFLGENLSKFFKPVKNRRKKRERIFHRFVY